MLHTCCAHCACLAHFVCLPCSCFAFCCAVFGICKFILPMASVRCASVVRVLYVCCAYAGHIVCNYCAFGPPMLCICCPALRVYVVYVVFLLRFSALRAYVVYVVFLLRFCCCVLRAYVQCYFFLRVCVVCVCCRACAFLFMCWAFAVHTMRICCNVVVHLDCMHNVGMCSVHVAHIVSMLCAHVVYIAHVLRMHCANAFTWGKGWELRCATLQPVTRQQSRILTSR